MNISPTGDGLNILIACDYVSHHNWMSFLCWYSISKNLPEASVFVASPRRLMQRNLFNWTRKCKVPLFLHKDADLEGQVNFVLDSEVKKPLLVVPPESVCVRDFDESGFSPESLKEVCYIDSELSCDCKKDLFKTFVTYNDGWGTFVTSSWINKMRSPFDLGTKYNQGELTVNEARIGRLWYAAIPLFQTVSGG